METEPLLLWDVIEESAVCRWLLQLQTVAKFCCLSDEVLLCFLWKTLCLYVTKLIAPLFNRTLWVYFKLKMLLWIVFSPLVYVSKSILSKCTVLAVHFCCFLCKSSIIAIKFTFDKQLKIFELQG